MFKNSRATSPNRQLASLAFLFVLLVSLPLLTLNLRQRQLYQSEAQFESELQNFFPTHLDSTDPEGIIVKYKSDVDPDSTSNFLGQKISRPKRYTRLADKTYAYALEKNEVQPSIELLQTDPNVEYVEPDYPIHFWYTPSDSQLSSQWYLNRISAPQAWDITKGSGNVAVAVVDTGVATNHPDLSGKVTKTMNTQKDQLGHGTLVSGIIGAATDNSQGIAAVGFNTTIYGVDIGDQAPTVSIAVSGINWAADNGATAVNLSWSSPPSQALSDAIDYAWNKGVVIVVAAGNIPTNKPLFPQSHPKAFNVAATTAQDKITGWSAWGTWVDIAAPGEQILSTSNNGRYAAYDGTSFSAPIVAGVAALVKAAHPSYTNQQIIDQICTTADQITGTGSKFRCGRVNAYQAVLGGGPTPPPSSGTPTPTGGPTQPPTPGNLTFKLRFQGITEQGLNQSLEINLSASGNTLVNQNYTASADNFGVYSFNVDNTGGQIAPGAYRLHVKGPSHLGKLFQNIPITQSGQIFNLAQQEDYLLRSGDVNGDNRITIEDVSQILKHYNQFKVPVTPGDTQMGAADITKDGFITIQDVALVAINWSDFTIEGE